MKSNEYWKTMETELQVMRSKRKETTKENSTTEQRQALSKQIHLMSVKINQHNKAAKHRAENPIDRSNTLVYRMFGKSERDLSPDEYREYNRVQHRLRRQELKQIIPFRIYFPQELDALLELQKLHIDYKYGDYSGGNFKDYCVKQLYVLSPN